MTGFAQSPPHPSTDWEAPGWPVWAWGDPGRRPGLAPHVRRHLTRTLGPAAPTPPSAAAPVSLPPGALPPACREELLAVVGPGWLREDSDTRLRHATGRSFTDLVALRSGALLPAPDAVVRPGDTDEVVAVLAACARHRVAVVPFGGGTSVVGGVTTRPGTHPAVVSVDLRRLGAIHPPDTVSLVVRAGAGATGPELDAALAEHDLTLGHLPQSYELATLGGYAATRSVGQASAGYGRFTDLVVGLVVATPRGVWRLGRGAPSAAGPDLVGVVLGSEGAFGVITEVTLRVHHRPGVRRWDVVALPDWDRGLALVRELAQHGPLPAVVRLSDPEETAATLAQAGGVGGAALTGWLRARGAPDGCLLLLGSEGTPATVRTTRRGLHRVASRHGALRLPAAIGTRFARARFAAPYLRDDLLDAGVVVETLETSASWTDLPRVHTAVGAAIRAHTGGPALVLSHVSHVYPHGASLYVTVLTRPEVDPAAQWRRIKAAATEEVLATGGTITHHHGVGTDHRPWLGREVGETGLGVLQAIKAELDPTGICNPGVLLPEAPHPGGPV